MRVLGVDFETSGLDSSTDRVIEVGAVVWQIDSAQPLSIYSELVLPTQDFTVNPEITKITGIENQMLKDFGCEPEVWSSKIERLAQSCDFFVAHNAPFDRGFYESECKKLGVEPVSLPWIDTVLDIPYPEQIKARNLTHVAADHKIVNPFAHRALFDVLTMLNLLSLYDFKEVQKRQASPAVEVISHVSYDDREQAKKMGFRWDPNRKQWFKAMKECDYKKMSFPFDTSLNTVNATI